MMNLLREWQVELPMPPRFKEQVWQRIEKAEASAVSPRTGFRGWIAKMIARPAVAFGYVAVLLLAGLTIGFWHGHRNADRMATELSTRYVQLMNSFESPR